MILKGRKRTALALILCVCMATSIIKPWRTTAALPGVTVQKYIMIDQFGYNPEGDKVAVLVDPQTGFNSGDSYTPGNTIQVRRVSDDSVVYSGSPKAWNNGTVQENSGDRGWWFDFSSVTAEGDYYIYDLQRNFKSYNFRISKDVYNNVLKAAIKTFYYQRIGTPHLAQHAGAAYVDAAALIGPNQDGQARNVFDRNNAATTRDLSGGWMDAGDFNKYVTYTAQPINELLSAYEGKPDIFTDDYNIPESGNGIPDIIDEVKWELDWLKKMQESDGGVLLKVGFPSSGGIGEFSDTPSKITRYRYYLPKCSSSTIITALNFAHASMVLGKFPSLKIYADDLRERSIKAWNWYQANPKNDNLDKGEVEAGDADMSLEAQGQVAAVASVYLYALTGNETYHTYFKNNYRKTWPLIDAYWGLYYGEQADGVMFYTTLPNADPVVKSYILERRDVQDFDHQFNDNDDLYRSYVPGWAYHWGSLQVRARLGASAYDFVQYNINQSKRDNYNKRAQNVLHYFHGVNPFSHVYLTNMGEYGAENSITQIYHSWFGDGTKWDNAPPGYLPGGPSEQYSGTSTPPRGQPSQKMYKDWNGISWNWPDSVDASWEITENAIYYQAGYIKLLAKFVAAPPTPTIPPAVPSGIAAAAVDTTSITVSWNKSEGASGYDIEVDGVIVNNGPATSYTHSNLTPGTTHNYRIRAKNTVGTSAWSSSASATTKLPPPPPSVPGSFTAIPSSSFSVMVSWGASQGATEYEIEIDGIAKSNGLGLSYNHTGLASSSTHKYRVRAKNSGGTSSWSSVITVTTPQAPLTSIIDVSHNGTSGYTFGQSSDQIKRYQTFIADSYTSITSVDVKIRKTAFPGDVVVELYETSGNKPTGNALAKAVISSALVSGDYKVVTAPLKYSGLKYGTKYAIVLGQTVPGAGGIYEWCAGVDVNPSFDFGKFTGSWVDESSISDGWMIVHVSQGSQPQQLPAMPTELTAASTGTSSIALSWKASAYAEGYELQADGVIINLPGSSTSYVHSGLLPGSTHNYRVRAKNSAGVSAWSGIVLALVQKEAIGVIDVSHKGNTGFTFGEITNQIKRYQTFTMDSSTRIERVEVKVRRFNGASDLVASLYETQNNKPVGNALKTVTVPSKSIGSIFTVVNVPMTYSGLIPGKTYAIVLGQTKNSNYANYEWCTLETNSTLKYGKYTRGIWLDESRIGDGWLKVYVNP